MTIPSHCVSFHCLFNYTSYNCVIVECLDFITQDTKVFILYIAPTLWVLYALPRIQKTVLVWEEEEIPWFVHPRISLALLR